MGIANLHWSLFSPIKAIFHVLNAKLKTSLIYYTCYHLSLRELNSWKEDCNMPLKSSISVALFCTVLNLVTGNDAGGIAIY